MYADPILELAKIAKAKGTLEGTLKRVYLMNKAKQYRREQRKKASLAQDARENLLSNF
jgi:hypothetical protein